ncbi:hypothetical protein ACHAWF_014210 [Thalassiosira exigua]
MAPTLSSPAARVSPIGNVNAIQAPNRRNITMFKRNRSKSSVKPIVVEDLGNELIPVLGARRFAVVLHNLLSPEECASLVRRAQDEGFDDALIQGPGGKQILRQDIRSCRRCIIDDAALADAMYVRILNAVRGTDLEKKLLHAPWVARNHPFSSGDDEGDRSEPITAVGLNERMRFLNTFCVCPFSSAVNCSHALFILYHHNTVRFVRGRDAGVRAGETSHVTVQLYLNDKFKGGETRILCGKRHYDVKPKMGSALIFDHDLLHQGSKVLVGTKYSVRTDIMFTPLKPPSEDGAQAETPES